MVDWIERGDVDLVVNTPTGSGARADGREIRRAAVSHGIPCLTTLAAGVSAARAIAGARSGEPQVLCLQELHGLRAAPRGAAASARPTGPRGVSDPPSAGGALTGEDARRLPADLERRRLSVIANERLGAYRLLRVADPASGRARARPVHDACGDRALGRRRG